MCARADQRASHIFSFLFFLMNDAQKVYEDPEMGALRMLRRGRESSEDPEGAGERARADGGGAGAGERDEPGQKRRHFQWLARNGTHFGVVEVAGVSVDCAGAARDVPVSLQGGPMLVYVDASGQVCFAKAPNIAAAVKLGGADPRLQETALRLFAGRPARTEVKVSDELKESWVELGLAMAAEIPALRVKLQELRWGVATGRSCWAWWWRSPACWATTNSCSQRRRRRRRRARWKSC